MRGKEFSELLYRLLLIEKAAPIESVAASIGMSYHSLHARLHNKTIFSADEIRDLIKVLKHVDLIDYFIKDTGMLAFERQEAFESSTGDSIFRRTNHLAIETANVLEAVETAMKDNKIDRRDLANIHKEIVEAERALATIRHALQL